MRRAFLSPSESRRALDLSLILGLFRTCTAARPFIRSYLHHQVSKRHPSTKSTRGRTYPSYLVQISSQGTKPESKSRWGISEEYSPESGAIYAARILGGGAPKDGWGGSASQEGSPLATHLGVAPRRAQHNLRGHPIGNLGLDTAWAATACASALFGVEEVELDAMGSPRLPNIRSVAEFSVCASAPSFTSSRAMPAGVSRWWEKASRVRRAKDASLSRPHSGILRHQMIRHHRGVGWRDVIRDPTAR